MQEQEMQVLREPQVTRLLIAFLARKAGLIKTYRVIIMRDKGNTWLKNWRGRPATFSTRESAEWWASHSWQTDACFYTYSE